MHRSEFVGPFRRPHYARAFWIWIGLMFVSLMCVAVVAQRLLGPRALHSHSVVFCFAVTFGLGVAVFWLVFRFGRVAWLVMALLMLSVALALRFFS